MSRLGEQFESDKLGDRVHGVHGDRVHRDRVPVDLVEYSKIESYSDSRKSGEPGGSDIVGEFRREINEGGINKGGINEGGINEGGINEEGLMTEDEKENDRVYNVAYNA